LLLLFLEDRYELVLVLQALLRYTLLQQQVAEVVAQPVRELGPVEAFLDRLVVVHRVVRQVVEVAEGVVALHQPLHLEVGHQSQVLLLVGLSDVTLALGGILLLLLSEEVRPEVRVRLAFHASHALERAGFVHAKD